MSGQATIFELGVDWTELNTRMEETELDCTAPGNSGLDCTARILDWTGLD